MAHSRDLFAPSHLERKENTNFFHDQGRSVRLRALTVTSVFGVGERLGCEAST
jgi:hypothetical protein